MTAVDWAVVVVLVLIFAPHSTFAVRYGLRRRWFGSWEGVSLLLSALAWSLVSLGFLVDYAHEIPDVLWVGIGAAASASGWVKLYLLETSDDPPRPED